MELSQLAVSPAAGLSALVVVPSIALTMGLPAFRFPHPGGPRKICTLTYHWVDTGRPEIFTADPSARRELVVQIWYPAKAKNPLSRRAPYVQNPVPLARPKDLPMFSFGHLKYVTTNAIPSIPVADDKPDYPVLIFLEAANGFRQMNTFQSPLFYWLGAAGPIDEQPAFSIVNAYSLVSLDRHLKGQPGALFNGPTGRYPEVFF